MTEHTQESGNKGRIRSVLALFFFLVLLPVGSYIYLKKGYDYQREAMRDLRKTDQMQGTTSLVLLSGQAPLNKIGEHFSLIGLLPETANEADYEKVLKRLHEQFDLPENLEFWTVFEGEGEERFRTFTERFTLPRDTAQLLYWTASEEGFKTFVDGMALNADEQAQLAGGLIVLVDDSLYVRRAFPFSNEDAMQQLVERTAILLPERSKPKPELRPAEAL